MMKNALIVAGLLIVALALFAFWRGEEAALALRGARAAEGTLAERVSLLNEGVELVLPDTDGPAPLLAQFHGCAGPRWGQERDWANLAAATGRAVMIVDSAGPRGLSRDAALREICGGKALLGQERAGDVHAALAIAAADERIDERRAVLAGWSHGAWTIMDALTLEAKRARPSGLAAETLDPLTPEGLILFYPYCGFGAHARGRVPESAPPTLVFLAGQDSIVDPAPCRRIFKRWREAGLNVEVVEYPDADHAFDDEYLEAEWRHLYDGEAHADSRRRVRAFLERL